MKSLLLTLLATVGLSGCYAELTPYNTGYYGEPTYATTAAVYTTPYIGPAYRPAPVYVSRPAPIYRRAPVYVSHHYRHF